MLNKISKTIGLQQKLQIFLPKPYLLRIYKLFNRTHFDYSDFIYDQACNASTQQMIEGIACNVFLTITEIIRGTYKNKVFEELDLQSVHYRYYCYGAFVKL